MGGATIQWLRDNLKLINSASESSHIAESLPNTNGVYMVPAMTGLGAPYWNPNAKGIITGLTRDTQAEHIVRAGDMPELDVNSRETHAFSAMRARTNHLMNGSDALDKQDVINNRSGLQQATLLAEYTMHGADAMKQETSKRQSFQIAAMNTSMYIANGADATKKAMSRSHAESGHGLQRCSMRYHCFAQAPHSSPVYPARHELLEPP